MKPTRTDRKMTVPSSPKQKAQQEHFQMSGNTARARVLLYELKNYYTRNNHSFAANCVRDAILMLDVASTKLTLVFVHAKERIDNETK